MNTADTEYWAAIARRQKANRDRPPGKKPWPPPAWSRPLAILRPGEAQMPGPIDPRP